MPHAKVGEAKEKMHKAVLHMQEEFAGIRTGRATPAIVEKLRVDYYGSEVPLQQLASFSVPEPRVLVIAPYDNSAVKAIEKAIQGSDLGLNPAIDGQLIRLPFPPLTEQRRKDLVKLVHTKTEESRVAVRNVRRHAHDELRKSEKDGEVSQDDLKRSEDELQKLTDTHIADIDAEGKRKEAELLEV
jgi:ribosome recycling factor